MNLRSTSDLLLKKRNSTLMTTASQWCCAKVAAVRATRCLHLNLLQPVVVRTRPDGWFEVVTGERRTRALRLLGWPTAPCVVTDLDDETASLAMLSENVARQSLDPVDEARAYASRMTRFG